MKIIRLSTFLDYGGIETKMINLSTVSDLNNDWIFCAIGKGGIAEKQIILNNKKVVCFYLPHKIPSLKAIFKLFLYFKKEKPDVVHTSGAEANFHGVIAARLAKIPVVVAEEIGIPSQSFLAYKIFKIVYRFSHFIVGESQIVVDNLKKKYSISEGKLRVVSNFAIFCKDFPLRTQKESTTFNIVSISRLESVKNIEGIIRTIARLRKERLLIKYVIVGDGSLKESLVELIKDLGLEKEIDMVGYQNNPSLFLLNADLYVLNSFSEGFSNSLLEAMYFKTPSLTTDVGAANEIIEEGISGWIIEKGNDEILYDKIKKIMLLDKRSRNEIGNNAHKKVIENYSIEVYLDNVLKIYKKEND